MALVTNIFWFQDLDFQFYNLLKKENNNNNNKRAKK